MTSVIVKVFEVRCEWEFKWLRIWLVLESWVLNLDNNAGDTDELTFLVATGVEAREYQ